MNQYESFLEQAESKVFLDEQRNEGASLEKQTQNNLKNTSTIFSNLELARTRASAIRKKTIENLEKYLIEFESEFSKKGGKIIWASSEKEVGAELVKIVSKRNIKSVYLKESPLVKEVNIEHSLNKEKITIFGHEPFSMSVSEAKFIVADTGSIVTIGNDEKEQRILQQASTQVFLASLDRVLPQTNDIDLFSTLYSSYAFGTASQAYTNIINGPKQANESQGPQEVFLFLIDNGRTELLAQPEQRQALACISCGACSNVCPVFQLVGSKTYDAVYSGPIGSVVMPYLSTEEDYKHLSYASTLCGKCKDVCPVKIDIPRMLQFNRRDYVEKGNASKKENISIYFWKTAMLKRSAMEKGQKVKNFMLKQFFRKDWGNRRDFPEAVSKSFNQQWKERKGLK
ncbi:MAG: 4Fe-4S dicluster domain-containing protein [Bacteroidota bacterium]|jgi:L-lactate dehydrogenase complex protein LldF